MKALKYTALGIVAVLAIIMVASNTANPTSWDATGFVEREVRKMMKDPDSVKFERVKFHPDEKPQGKEISGTVCGYVNAKNSFGAYTGFVRFISNITVKNNGRNAQFSQPSIEIPDNPISVGGIDESWSKLCK
ncbi:TPA: hypothetical protein ACGGR5_000534 [Vibrio cholerae]